MIAQEGLGPIMRNGVMPATLHVFWDDFDGMLDSITDGVVYEWTVSTSSAPTKASYQNSKFGVLRLANSGSDGAYVTANTNSGLVTPTIGKRFAFKTKFQVTDGDGGEIFIGLATPDDTEPYGGVVAGVYFLKATTDATVQFVYEDNSVAVATDILELADTTNVELAFEVLYVAANAAKVWVYVDGVPVNGLNGHYIGSGFPDDNMGLVMQAMSDGDADNFDIDYWGLAQER